ncbi:MAG: MATE family efflux transporter [Planktomarina sp.]
MVKTVWTDARDIAKLAFPIAISMMGATLIGVVDTIMVAPLGTIPLAAVSLTAAVMIVFYSALYGFISVTGVRMAEGFGAGNNAALSNATRTGLRIALVTGIVGAILMIVIRPYLIYLDQPVEVVAALQGYWITMALTLVPFTLFYVLKGLFDAIDAPWIGVALAFFAVALNVPANWVLIHGLGDWQGLGVLGAGLASLLSQTVCLGVAVWVWRYSSKLSVARVAAVADPAEPKTQITQGSAVSLGYLGEGGAYAVASFLMGWFGAVALAANQIVASIGGVLYMVPLGVAIAVSLRIGNAMGKGNTHRIAQIGGGALIVIVAWMAGVTALILIFGSRIAHALFADPAVVTLAISLFIITALMQIFDGVQGTMSGACRGMTDNFVPVSITMVSYWAVALPLGYTIGFVWGFGPLGVWLGYGIGLILAATLLTWRFFTQATVRAV